jgi:alkylhydroperoxidase family enzyme
MGCGPRVRRRAILQITLIAAWFNYVNRVTDAQA